MPFLVLLLFQPVAIFFLSFFPYPSHLSTPFSPFHLSIELLNDDNFVEFLNLGDVYSRVFLRCVFEAQGKVVMKLADK